jgi:adenylate kinase
MPLVLILLGPPGAGKGTQAVHLCTELGLPHVSTGDLFRENRGQGTPLGRKAEEFMSRGELVPDALVLDMLFERVSRPDCDSGYLLDGFPRTVTQAEAFDAMADGATDHDDVIVFRFDVPYRELLLRLSGRRWCPTCQATYHVKNNPPQRDALCDKDGTTVIQREDDKEEAVKRRLKDYEVLTAPLVEYYRTKMRLVDIDGFRDPEEVFAELVAALGMSKEAAR